MSDYGSDHVLHFCVLGSSERWLVTSPPPGVPEMAEVETAVDQKEYQYIHQKETTGWVQAHNSANARNLPFSGREGEL